LQQEIWPAISGVVKLLEHSDEYVCRAAINCLSSLGAQSTYSPVHLESFALLRLLPSRIAAGDLASNFWCCEVAGAFQQGYLWGRNYVHVQSWSTKYVFPLLPGSICTSEATPQRIATGDPASNFWCCEIAGGF
jgi:hypothetical protein